MLALRLNFHQVIVADEILDGTDMVGELLGKRQGTAYQTSNALPQCVVESLDVIGLAAFLLIARCCAAGITPSYTTYWSV